jgi:hypothetical protein
MKNKSIRYLLWGLFLSLLAVACQSAPPPQEPSPPSPVPAPPAAVQPAAEPSPAQVDPAIQDHERALDRAAAARSRAIDFDGPVYFPSDWEDAEAQYQIAREESESTPAKLKEATALLDWAADVYDDIFNRSLGALAQDREAEILQARSEALDARRDFPDQFAEADSTADQALAQYEDKDYYAALESANSALDSYRILKLGIDANAARQEVVNWNFVPYDPDDFELAETAGRSAIDAYDAHSLETARDDAEEALLRYNLVLNAGWQAAAAEQRALAAKQRQIALNVKANVAVKNDFEIADTIYKQGETAYQGEQFANAADRYSRAATLFEMTQEAAEVKRRVAEESIRAAEERVAASDETARAAEEILEGGGAQ